MSEFLGSIFWLVVTLGVLITFHEFGHYWVARRMGVKVLRFSVGFGKPLWLHRARNGTEFVVAAIPLGGYVRMADEREAPVDVADLNGAFNRKPVWARIAIVAAGPIANLLLAFVVFWVMFMVGKLDFSPRLGEPSGMAAQAGLRAGDLVTAVDAETVATHDDLFQNVLIAAIDRRDITLTLRDADGAERSARLPLSTIPAGVSENTLFSKAIGLKLALPEQPPIVGDVQWLSPASKAGLESGDVVLAINGQRVSDFKGMRDAINQHARPDQPIDVLIRRGDSEMNLAIVPKMSRQPDGKNQFTLGITSVDTRDITLRYGPIGALGAAAIETKKGVKLTLGMIKRLLTGAISPRQVSGTITIAQVSNDSAQQGLAAFLGWLALISINLFILNLLPVPILDGGHLLYYLIESVKGSPVSERVMEAGQYVGLVLILGLVGLSFFNDITRVLTQ